MSESPANGPRQPLNAFEQYLGPGILPGDPFSLLGLTSALPTESQVLAALQQRLGLLAAHPTSTSPGGNEVRFALHAAAAKLLERVDRPPPAAGGPQAQLASPAQDSLALAIAQGGGWNAAMLQQVAMIAQAEGKDVADVVRGAGAGPAGPAVRPRPAGAATRAPFAGPASVMEPPRGEFAQANEPDPVRKYMIVGAWVVGGVFALLVALTAVIVVIARMPAPTPAASPVPTQGAGDTPANSATSPVGAPGPAVVSAPSLPAAAQPAKAGIKHIEEWADLVRELDACAPALRTGAPEAQTRLRSVMSRMAARWTAATPDERQAAVNGAVEAVYAVKEESEPCRVLVRLIAAPAIGVARAPLAGPDEVWPAAFSAGLLARLTSERDLPRAIVREIDDLAAETFALGGGAPAEASFEAGAAAALTALTGKLIPVTPPENEEAGKPVADAWKRWLAAAAALRGPDSDLYLALALAALDRLITASPEPTANQSVLEAITAVTTGLSWRESDASRRWLLRAFDSKSVSSADLFAVTSAIATRSGAPGVDQTMVLHPASQEASRAQLRDQYASVWGMASAEVRDAALTKWGEVARAELARADLPSGLIPQLVQGLSLARLNAAAALIWSGKPDSAVTVLADLDSGLSNRLSSLAGAGRPNPIGRGLSSWAMQYLPMMQAGGRIADRRKLLQDFQGPPNGADAQIIIDEACGSGNDGIRADAQALIKRFAADASIVAAMLAEVPTMPQTVSCTALVSMVALTNMPPPRDAGWRVAARRALVARLLEVLVGRSELGIVDEVSAALAETYAEQTPPPVNVPAKTDESGPILMRAPPPAEAAASAVRAKWLREAEAAVPTGREPLSLAQAASARAARARIAQGRVQEFNAAQADICDLMAFVIAAERVSRAPRAAEILADLSQQRRGASHIFVQIAACERAALRLWLLRLGEAEQGGAS